MTVRAMGPILLLRFFFPEGERRERDDFSKGKKRCFG